MKACTLIQEPFKGTLFYIKPELNIRPLRYMTVPPRVRQYSLQAAVQRLEHPKIKEHVPNNKEPIKE